ncbi:MAG: tyrosine-type recombinase/integrase [Alphaproteobacteria bacterium]
MAKIKLNANVVAKIKPTGERNDKERYYCSENIGLMLEVRATGVKTFYVNYQLPDGTKRQFKIGRYPEISFENAKKKTLEIRGLAMTGVDPTNSRQKSRGTPLFCEFADTYLKHVKDQKSSWKDDECIIRIWLNPNFGRKKLDQIDTVDISRLHNTMKQSRSSATANRTLSIIKHMFNVAISWGEINKNPAKGIKKFRENQKERYLSVEEIKRLMAVLNEEKNHSIASLVMLLLFTGARKSEALKMKWSDVDFKNAIWTVPQENSKSRKVRHIPLSNIAIRILQNIERVEDSPYVFVGRYDIYKPMNSPKKTWYKIRELAGLPDVRLHDLRHSYASLLVSNGRSLYEVQKILGHSSPNMTQRYSHFSKDTLITAVNSVGNSLNDILVIEA